MFVEQIDRKLEQKLDEYGTMFSFWNLRWLYMRKKKIRGYSRKKIKYIGGYYPYTLFEII